MPCMHAPNPEVSFINMLEERTACILQFFWMYISHINDIPWMNSFIIIIITHYKWSDHTLHPILSVYIGGVHFIDDDMMFMMMMKMKMIKKTLVFAVFWKSDVDETVQKICWLVEVPFLYWMELHSVTFYLFLFVLLFECCLSLMFVTCPVFCLNSGWHFY